MSTALALVGEMTAVEIFNGKNVDAILEGIRSKARAEAAKLDISTKTGREDIASLAYKIARTSTGIDDEGKALVEGEKKRLALIDADRKRYRDALAELKVEIRKPLTDWENAEKSRVAGHENALADMEDLGRLQPGVNIEFIEYRILSLSKFRERVWQEFENRAKTVMGATLETLKAALESERKSEADRAELARLRAEQIQREQKEREERIAREAADRERRLAEAREQEATQAAERERQRIEQEKFAAEAHAKAVEAKAEADRLAAIERERVATEKAETDRIAAEAKAQREKAEAVAAEGRRIEAQRQKEKQEAEARERNKAHAAKINREVLADLIRLNVPEDMAKLIIGAIAKGSVAHTKISY